MTVTSPPPIASWTKPSDIYTLTIEKGSNTYGLEGGFIQFDYFESIFSPHISGNLVIADTGFGVEQGALISALQITGNEKIRVLINHPSGSLDFDDDIHHFIVDSIKDLGSNENTKITSFRVVSKYEKKNKITSVEGAYDNNIRNSFQDILTNKLGVPTNKLNLENTQNSLSFKGSGRTPFDIGLFLAPRSRPVSGAPGFVFYESKNGFNFVALNSLIAGGVVGHYTSKGVSAGGENQHSSCRIIKYEYIKRPDIGQMEGSGLFRSQAKYFNPLSQEVTTNIFNMSDQSFVFDSLGSESFADQYNLLDQEYPSTIYSIDNSSLPTTYGFFDTGNNGVAPLAGISTACNDIIQAINNDPRLYQAMAIMRYHSLMTEVIDMVIPCNIFLKAGHVIECEFKKIAGNITSASPNDEWQSGKYLIMHLSHKFNQHGDMGSTTHLRVARDTRGMYSP